ncbi:MAG: hypothetical protein AAGA62_17075, partial [Bacteroidota bacterium]
MKRRERHFHYLVLKGPEDRTLIQQRGEKDIWQSLYQFPLVEVQLDQDPSSSLALHADWPDWLPAQQLRLLHRSPPFRQQGPFGSVALNPSKSSYWSKEWPFSAFCCAVTVVARSENS